MSYLTYFLAPALVKLRDEVNAKWPDRSKASDGWIGDASHSARASDHNPDYSDGGVVRAIDVTNDGIDVDWFISRVIADARTAYVISRGRIWQNPAVYKNGGWFNYTGSNKHDKHVHVSVRSGAFQSQVGAWLSDPAPVVSASIGGGAFSVGGKMIVFMRNEAGDVYALRPGKKKKHLTPQEWELWQRLGGKLSGGDFNDREIDIINASI